MKHQYYTLGMNYDVKVDPKPKPRGLGDTIKKIFDHTGVSKIFSGRKCGCKRRQEKLNQMFPYN